MIDVVELLRSDLRQQRDDLSAFLCRGDPKDYAEYCKAVGAVQTLERVLLAITELEIKAIEE